MSGDNKYILNLHHNGRSGNIFHTPSIDYLISHKKYLVALYDEAYYSLYKAGNDRKGSYYGTITTSCYSLDTDYFNYLIVKPTICKTSGNLDKTCFTKGQKLLASGDKLVLSPTPLHEHLLYIYSGSKLLTSRIDIPESDINTIPGKQLDYSGSAYYLLEAGDSSTDPVKLIECDSQGRKTGEQVGFLSSTTTVIDDDGGQYYLWHGNPFTNSQICKEQIINDARISLFRDKGKVIYEFIDSQGTAIQEGKNFCDNLKTSDTETPYCKMENVII